ncbi:hypothetical protein GOODEAATRI_017730, partial [Goodea atripinnis]
EGSAVTYKSSTTFPDETLTFIKSYPLMDESVPSVNDRPFFTRTTSRWKAQPCTSLKPIEFTQRSISVHIRGEARRERVFFECSPDLQAHHGSVCQRQGHVGVWESPLLVVTFESPLIADDDMVDVES